MKTRVFSDFDDFSESVGDADMSMMMHSLNNPIWRLSQVDLPGMHVQLGSLGSGNIVEGKSLDAGHLIYLPLSGFNAHTANGIAFQRNSFLVLKPGTEFDLCIKEGHDWCSVFIPGRLLPNSECLYEHTSVEDAANNVVIHSDSYTASRFGAVIKSIMSAAYCSSLEASPAAENAVAHVTSLLPMICSAQGLASNKQIGRRPRHSKRDIVRRCKAFLEENEDQPVRLADLVAASQVQERELRSTFNAYFGLPPARFLQLRQYHRIRRALKKADVGTESVTDILLRHGIYEFGRFAGRYRRIFGELPSTTLKKNHRVR